MERRPGLEDLPVGLQETAILIDDLVERSLRREEGRFDGRHDDGVEQVPPARSPVQIGIDGVGHHPLGVLPSRVGDQHQAPPGVFLIEQCRDQLRIRLDEPAGICGDLLLQHPHRVRGLQRVADRPIEAPIADRRREVSTVHEIHQLPEQRRLGEREERVEEDEPGIGEIDDDPRIGAANLVVFEHPGAVRRADHVAEAGRLEQVALLEIEREATDHGARIELEVVDGPPHVGKCETGVLVGALLPLLDPVVDQRVVHVVADGPDGAQVERAVAEDRPLRIRQATTALTKRSTSPSSVAQACGAGALPSAR